MLLVSVCLPGLFNSSRVTNYETSNSTAGATDPDPSVFIVTEEVVRTYSVVIHVSRLNVVVKCSSTR